MGIRDHRKDASEWSLNSIFPYFWVIYHRNIHEIHLPCHTVIEGLGVDAMMVYGQVPLNEVIVIFAPDARYISNQPFHF